MKEAENNDFFPKKCMRYAGKSETAAKKIGRHLGPFAAMAKGEDGDRR